MLVFTLFRKAGRLSLLLIKVDFLVIKPMLYNQNKHGVIKVPQSQLKPLYFLA